MARTVDSGPVAGQTSDGETPGGGHGASETTTVGIFPIPLPEIRENGGSDGTRTRDLRRDRPAEMRARSTAVSTRGPGKSAASAAKVEIEDSLLGRRLDIYDGRARLGTVHVVDARGGAVAVLPDGRQLGPFGDMAAARAALREEARRR